MLRGNIRDTRQKNESIHGQIPLIHLCLASIIFILQHHFRKSRRLEDFRKKNVRSIITALRKRNLQNGDIKGVVLDVDRRDSLSEREFVVEYLNTGIPVIFNQQAIGWPCTKKWNLDYFKTEFCEEEFSVVETTGLVEPEHDRTQGEQYPVLIEKLKAGEFVTSLREGSKRYLRFCPIMESHPKLRKDLDLDWLKRYRRCFLGISYQTFIGPAGRRTPLHSETTAFFYIMAHGEKTWTLFSPASFPLLNPIPDGRGYNYSKINSGELDEGSGSGAELLTRYTCKLKKGDILFVPAWMWHEVVNDSESWGVSYRFTSLRGFFRHFTFWWTRVIHTKPSFIEILYYSFFKKDLSKRGNNLLTPRIFVRDE